MKLADPPPKYNQAMQRRLQHDLELADSHNRKQLADVDVHPARLILRSPNGTRWDVRISNSGILSAVALP